MSFSKLILWYFHRNADRADADPYVCETIPILNDDYPGTKKILKKSLLNVGAPLSPWLPILRLDAENLFFDIVQMFGHLGWGYLQSPPHADTR